jgi:hypothetical protein
MKVGWNAVPNKRRGCLDEEIITLILAFWRVAVGDEAQIESLLVARVPAARKRLRESGRDGNPTVDGRDQCRRYHSFRKEIVPDNRLRDDDLHERLRCKNPCQLFVDVWLIEGEAAAGVETEDKAGFLFLDSIEIGKDVIQENSIIAIGLRKPSLGKG